jgi:transcriptional regulator with XRE-family HTH domain
MELEEGGGSSDFGTLLRRHRLAAGLSQEALAERARMSSDGISALERGHRRTPQRETLALLVGALALDDHQRQELEMAATRPRSVRRGASAVAVGPWQSTDQPVLPLSLTSFIGRMNELEEIATLVREYRLVTLTGSGGVGKTQTALQLASSMRDRADAAVFFVALAPLNDPTLIASAVASGLGVQEVPNRPLLDTLIAYLKNKAVLLILDNCEHVIGEAANVAYRLLLSCPSLRILATSREALRTAGERAYRLPSLSDSEAVELFVDRARAADFHFALGSEDESIVTDLCRRLGGIPLAIEMAAARVQTIALREMLAMRVGVGLECDFVVAFPGDHAKRSASERMLIPPRTRDVGTLKSARRQDTLAE